MPAGREGECGLNNRRDLHSFLHFLSAFSGEAERLGFEAGELEQLSVRGTLTFELVVAETKKLLAFAANPPKSQQLGQSSAWYFVDFRICSCDRTRWVNLKTKAFGRN